MLNFSGYSSGGDISQSAFPLHTPGKMLVWYFLIHEYFDPEFYVPIKNIEKVWFPTQNVFNFSLIFYECSCINNLPLMSHLWWNNIVILMFLH